MTNATKATHTPGAIRAATILWENIFQKARAVDDSTGQRKRAWISMTADLIDKETAAPDLLAALTDCGNALIDRLPSGHPDFALVEKARAIIAKAKVEENPVRSHV